MDEIIDAKRKKLDGDENQLVGSNNPNGRGEFSCSANAAIIAGTSSGGEFKSEMCKLNDDCFEYLFDWLSLKDLLVLRRTCKEIKAVVDYYIELKYSQLRHLHVDNYGHTLKAYQMRLTYFDWIKHLRFRNTRLTSADQIDGIKSILNQLESLELLDVKMSNDSIKMLLEHCCRLKCLSLKTTKSTRMVIGTGNEWLRGKYPTLENIRVQIGTQYKYGGLLNFFQRNPNIRTFSTDTKFLSVNRHLMVGSKLKFNQLNLTVNGSYQFIHNLANYLHGQEFYEKLHLYVDNYNDWWSEDQSENLWKLRNLEMLSMFSLPQNVSIPVVESINKLHIETCTFKDDQPHTATLMATNFINLKRVKTLAAYLHHVRSFVCYAPKLEQILVRTIVHKNGKLIDFSDFLALNEERKQLADACKVTIYVNEKIYLNMKWSGNVNLSMIELKRIGSIKKEDLFDGTLSQF